MLENFSAKGVPLWVTLVAIIFGFFGVVLGLITMIDPEFQNVPVDAVFLGHQLGGRSMALGVVMLAAVGLRHRAGYLVGFVAGLFRDLGDVIAGFGDGPINPIVPLIMMAVGFACIGAIVQATNQLMAAEASGHASSDHAPAGKAAPVNQPARAPKTDQGAGAPKPITPPSSKAPDHGGSDH